MMISFFKVRETALPPDRAHPSDAGMDIFYCPDSYTVFKGQNIHVGTDEFPEIEIEAGGNVLLPTGLKFGIPHGYMLQVCNRGSMGAKRSLVVGAHIVDSGYSGEVFVDLHNIGTARQTIKPGDKIAQLVMVPVMYVLPMEAHREESLYGMAPITISDRGEGALGSSEKKS